MANTPGHRDLTPDEVELIRELKQLSGQIAEALDRAADLNGVNADLITKARLDSRSAAMFGTAAVTDR